MRWRRRTTEPLKPADLVEIREFIDRHRSRRDPYDVVASGATPGSDQATAATIVAPWQEAGATWWIEDISMWRFGRPSTRDAWPYDEIVDRVRRGPLRLA